MEAQPRLIRRPEVLSKTGLRRSTLYDLMAHGRFPRPVPLVGTTVAWIEADVDAWIANRIAKSSIRPRPAGATP